jgi:type 1 glutamine amidotransferase
MKLTRVSRRTGLRVSSGAFLGGGLALTRIGLSQAASSASPRSRALTQALAPLNVLVVTATAGFRHDSIPTAIRVVTQIGQQDGAWTTTVLGEVGDLTSFGPALLSRHQVLCFLNTSGELPLEAPQRAALLDFVKSGGGFVGTHSATDTLYGWLQYGDLIGGYFREHPWSQRVTLRIEDETHPATAPDVLPRSWEIEDEIYVFRSSVRARPNVRVLASLDTASVDTSGVATPDGAVAGDFPLIWCAQYGAGRVFYNALGHPDAVWEDLRFGAHLRAAILWTAGR